MVDQQKITSQSKLQVNHYTLLNIYVYNSRIHLKITLI